MKITLQSYLEGLKAKTVAVIGLGVSNLPLVQMLLQAGVSVTACDKRERESFGNLATELETQGVKLKLGETYLEGLEAQVIFRTPGMRPDLPQLIEAQAKGAELTSEMEVFFQVCPCPIIGVTGSDGKTTTTTIIDALLKVAGYTTHLGGNIGHPLLADVPQMTEEDWAVVELSSFQLMTMKTSPDIAVVTNLAPNHLDVHKSMEEYVEAKKNIFLYQTPGQKAVLNGDNQITQGFASQAHGTVVSFSRCQDTMTGVYLKEGAIWTTVDGYSRSVLPVEEILIPGVHNIENYMAAIAVLEGLVPDTIIRSFAQTFGGVEHRIELVREWEGVRYYNDSIASSPSRTTAGLRSFDQPVILIAGGYDKQIPFDTLATEVVERVKYLVLTGHTADKIKTAVETCPSYQGSPALYLEDDFDQAVVLASQLAEEGDIVILSPACASFDHFANFAQRGNHFKELILALPDLPVSEAEPEPAQELPETTVEAPASAEPVQVPVAEEPASAEPTQAPVAEEPSPADPAPVPPEVAPEAPSKKE